MKHKKDLLVEAYEKVILTEGNMMEAVGEIIANVMIIAAAGMPAVIQSIRDEMREKAEKAKAEKAAREGITNKTISNQQFNAEKDANYSTPSFMRQTAQQNSPPQTQ